MEFQGKKAIYLQIVDHLCEQILLKTWRADEKILSVREMAVNLQVNPNTVVRAYEFLEQRRIISLQRGIGYFVTKDAVEKILMMKKEIFLTEELPQVFKMMDLLNIDLKLLKTLYEKRMKYR